MSKDKQLDPIWESLEPCIKDKLVSIDSMLRTIWNEATIFGVKRTTLEKEIPKRMIELMRKVSESA